MESGIILSQTDVRKILAKALCIDEKQIVQSKYSYIVTGNITEKLNKLLEQEAEIPVEEDTNEEAE